MKSSNFGVSLIAALRSKLARKIAFCVFLSIVVIEVLILVPSYLKRENELVQKQEYQANLVIKNSFSRRSIPFEFLSIEQLNQSLSMHNVLGFKLKEGEDLKTQLGDLTGLSVDSNLGRSSYYDRAAKQLDMQWQINFPELGIRQVQMRLDVSHIDTQLQLYVVRIIGLVLIISAFVTLSTMVVLWWLVLSPILKLEDQLKHFSSLETDRENLSPLLQRKDEIGELFIEFGRMRNRILDATDKISHLAVTDQLTGLHNRRKLDDAMLLEIARVKRYQIPLSIIMCDLDHFKSINDTYGHKTGDDVIIAASALIKNAVRGSDIVGRWGGEEFMIICPQTEQEGASVLAEKIRVDMAMLTADFGMDITASFGVAEYLSDEACEALLCRADKALYLAKSEGRNQVQTAG